MATPERQSPVAQLLPKLPIQGGIDMPETGEASGAAGVMSGKATSATFMAAIERCEWNQNGKYPRSMTSERGSKPGDWRS